MRKYFLLLLAFFTLLNTYSQVSNYNVYNRGEVAMDTSLGGIWLPPVYYEVDIVNDSICVDTAFVDGEIVDSLTIENILANTSISNILYVDSAIIGGRLIDSVLVGPKLLDTIPLECKHGGYLCYDTVIYDTTFTDTTVSDAIDSIYIRNTGIPNQGDLNVPDLEVKVKMLWYDTKIYFLIRRMDDVLVNSYSDIPGGNSIKDGIQNQDATGIHFFMYEGSDRTDKSNTIYEDGTFSNFIASFRWVWGSDDFEGSFNGETYTTLEDAGCEMIQWSDNRYYYTKLSIDLAFVDPVFGDSLLSRNYAALGFEVEINENDFEYLVGGKYAEQTRVYYSKDSDSSATLKRNVVTWPWLYFNEGNKYEDVTGVDETPALKSFTLYPNPVNNYLHINQDEFVESEYMIYNMMGQLVQTGSVESNDNLITVESLKAGAYVMVLKDYKGYSKVSRFIKF